MFEQAASLWRRLLGRSQPAPRTSEDERRVWVRFPADLETHVVAPSRGSEEGTPARIRDISLGGCKLQSARAFDPGALLTVVLPSANGGPSLSVLACVVHCQAAAAGEWHLGCNFSRELDEADLRAFGAARARATDEDGRHWERFPCDVTATFQLVADETGKRLSAQVANISASGIALLVTEEVPAGMLLSADLQGPSGRPPLTILACVVHVVRYPDGRRLLGCNFIRALSESDLRGLLSGATPARP